MNEMRLLLLLIFIGSSFILVECFSQDIKRNLNSGLLGSNNNTWGPPLQNNNIFKNNYAPISNNVNYNTLPELYKYFFVIFLGGFVIFLLL
tara:strand:- start:39 stop:311 length:273 start_codon:yes stop_codon:yes gene_type:complete